MHLVQKIPEPHSAIEIYLVCKCISLYKRI